MNIDNIFSHGIEILMLTVGCLILNTLYVLDSSLFAKFSWIDNYWGMLDYICLWLYFLFSGGTGQLKINNKNISSFNIIREIFIGWSKNLNHTKKLIAHFYFKMILVICFLEKGRVWTKTLNTVNPKIRHILKWVRNK